MSSNDPVQSVSKSVKQKRAKIAAWILPASVFAVLGIFFSLYFLPLGIILFMVALAIVGISVLRQEAQEFVDADE